MIDKMTNSIRDESEIHICIHWATENQSWTSNWYWTHYDPIINVLAMLEEEFEWRYAEKTWFCQTKKN